MEQNKKVDVTPKKMTLKTEFAKISWLDRKSVIRQTIAVVSVPHQVP